MCNLILEITFYDFNPPLLQVGNQFIHLYTYKKIKSNTC